MAEQVTFILCHIKLDEGLFESVADKLKQALAI